MARITRCNALVSLLDYAEGDYPLTINTPWAMILCKFNDVAQVNQPRHFFDDFLTTPGTGGLYDYWKDVSHGAISLEGSKVFGIEDPSDPTTIGWYTMNYSFAPEIKEKDDSLGESSQKIDERERNRSRSVRLLYYGSSERNRGCRLGGRFDTESMDCAFNDLIRPSQVQKIIWT